VALRSDDPDVSAECGCGPLQDHPSSRMQGEDNRAIGPRDVPQEGYPALDGWRFPVLGTVNRREEVSPGSERQAEAGADRSQHTRIPNKRQRRRREVEHEITDPGDA